MLHACQPPQWSSLPLRPAQSEDAGLLHADAVRVAFDFFSKRAALGFIVPEWLPTPENVQYHAAVAQLDTAVYRIIADRQQRLRGKDAPTKKSQVDTPGSLSAGIRVYSGPAECTAFLGDALFWSVSAQI